VWAVIPRKAFKNPGAATARWPEDLPLFFEPGPGWLQSWTHSLCCWVALGFVIFHGTATGARGATSGVIITNALQLRQLAGGEEWSIRPVRLAGVAVWVGNERDQFILQDESGMMTVNLDLHGRPLLHAGQRMRLQTHCLVGHGQATCGALVDNDGIHAVREQSNRIFLPRGWHPLRVEWFNHEKLAALEVEWQGPGIPRQPISNNALMRLQPASEGDGSPLALGLNYRCYEGKWYHLPDFSRMSPKKQGMTANFDLGVCSRQEEVGLVFEGGIQVPQDGLYTFWTKSDDGSKLFIDDPAIQLEVLGAAEPPSSQLMQVVPGQPVSAEHDFQWAEVEGTVSFINRQPDAARLELSSSRGRLQVEVYDPPVDCLQNLVGSRIRVNGILRSAWSVTQPNNVFLLLPSLRQISIIEMPPDRRTDCPTAQISSLAEPCFTNQTLFLAHIRGTLGSNSTRFPIGITDRTGRMAIRTKQALPSMGAEVEALGWPTRSGDDLVMTGVFIRELSPETNGVPAVLPLITQALQAKNFVRAEAERGYPVKIRGVITARIFRGFAIQDPTWSIFFRLNNGAAPRTPKVGECWEITGKTTMDFAPTIQVDKAVYLSAGILPDPIRPSWDELINGSLDTQFIELQGVAAGVGTNTLGLLTRGGKIKLQLYDLEPQTLAGLENAVICLRGVLSPMQDTPVQFVPANLRLFNTSITVDEPAPANPFAIPMKRVSDLLFFDPHANALQRIQIAGQVVHIRRGEYFLMDGDYGLRFQTKSRQELRIGELVKIVGFPDLSGSSPALRECLVQRTGRAAMPQSRQLPGDSLFAGKFDATLVRVQGTLVNSSVDSLEQVLELQAGNRGFMARLEKKNGWLSNLKPGSRLDLTGVYAGQGGDLASSRGVEAFELLLNSPTDVRVLARPSWWTVQHALTVLGGMVLVIIGASVWIVILRRQVEERTRRLAIEIQRREQVEHQRTLEAERSRIAQDLHDDLGATLTQIRFLSAVEIADPVVSTATRDRLKQVSDKSLQMVTSLDEIVWAVNPANDSVRSLAAYLRHMAAEFFRATAINCRFDVDKSLPVVPLPSEARHNLYLTTREALNNCAKHSQATEVWLRIHWREQTLHIVIEDNGLGFASPLAVAGGNGLTNMRRRMAKIGGSFDCDTRPGFGTIYQICLPID